MTIYLLGLSWGLQDLIYMTLRTFLKTKLIFGALARYNQGLLNIILYLLLLNQRQEK